METINSIHRQGRDRSRKVSRNAVVEELFGGHSGSQTVEIPFATDNADDFNAFGRDLSNRAIDPHSCGRIQVMPRRDKILDTLLRGTSDANIAFSDLCSLLKRLGFAERVRGDHHIFTRDDVAEILNLQPKQAKAKPYQVKQVRTVILRYRLAGDDDDDE